MNQKHTVLIGPGLHGRTEGARLLTRNWAKKYDLHPVIVPIKWKDGAGFEPKLKQVVKLVDKFIAEGNKVSLLGLSASGSAMGNVFLERKDVISRVVNCGGFMRAEKVKDFRSFNVASKMSPAFRESVHRFSRLESTLTTKDRKKILTVRPFWDEVVPPETVVIEGALNTTVPMIEHVVGLALSLIKYDPVIMFLKGEKD